MKKHKGKGDLGDERGMAVGVAWYSREGWERIRAIAADPDRLENSYEEWLTMMTRTLGQLNSEGLFPEKVELDVEKLATWCKERGRPIDASARAEFVSRYLRTKHESPHKLGGG